MVEKQTKTRAKAAKPAKPRARKAAKPDGSTIAVVNVKNEKVREVSLAPAVFQAKVNSHLIYEAVKQHRAGGRRGTHMTKNRALVSGSGKKPWRQKGTGRARVGALGVPHRRGGGAAFGPKPRHYISKVNRKARRKALRSALSVHAARGSLAVLPVDSFDEPKTSQAAEGLQKWGAAAPTLVVVTGEEAAAAKSFRNIPRVAVATAEGVGVAEIVGARSLVVSEPSLEVLEQRSAAVSRGGEEAA
jgi:large subunit ribosomal protein L4